MGIHEDICRRRLNQGTAACCQASLHDDDAAEAAEVAVYAVARSLGRLTTDAARIATTYGRSLNL